MNEKGRGEEGSPGIEEGFFSKRGKSPYLKDQQENKKICNKYKSYNAYSSLPEKKNPIRLLPGLKKDYLKHVEGVKAYVPFKGPVAKVIADMEAGVRSGFSYCGAENVSVLWKNAKFMRVTPQGVRERGAHDVVNY